MSTRYAGDPYWIKVKYSGSKCHRCEREIKKGERAFRYKTGALYCDTPDCGQHCDREFSAAAEDEDFMNTDTGNY